MAAQYSIAKTGNYIVVTDLNLSQEVLNIPAKFSYYAVENVDGNPSPVLFFYISGGIGSGRVGGFNVYDSTGTSNFNTLTYSTLITFLRTNTGL